MMTLRKIFSLKSVRQFMAHQTDSKRAGFRDHVRTVILPESRSYRNLHLSIALQLLRFLHMFSFKSGFTIEPCDRYGSSRA